MMLTVMLIMSPFLFRQAYIQYNRIKNTYAIIVTLYLYIIRFNSAFRRKSKNKTSVDDSEPIDWVLLNQRELDKCKVE